MKAASLPRVCCAGGHAAGPSFNLCTLYEEERFPRTLTPAIFGGRARLEKLSARLGLRDGVDRATRDSHPGLALSVGVCHSCLSIPCKDIPVLIVTPDAANPAKPASELLDTVTSQAPGQQVNVLRTAPLHSYLAAIYLLLTLRYRHSLPTAVFKPCTSKPETLLQIASLFGTGKCPTTPIGGRPPEPGVAAPTTSDLRRSAVILTAGDSFLINSSSRASSGMLRQKHQHINR